MDRAPNDTPTPSPNYVLGQLARALRAAAINATNPSVAPNAEEKAKARAEEWKRIAQSMADGTLNIGSRAPISGIPEWCTPKIVTGGFATGELLAEGPLLPHEEELLKRVGTEGHASPRLLLNNYYMSEAGMLELQTMLHNGTYRINIPEEAALLVIAWLLEHDKVNEATEILNLIQPFFSRLRFYPEPAATPMAISAVVSVTKVSDVRASLSGFTLKKEVVVLKRSIEHWRALQDDLISIFVETFAAGAEIPTATYGPPGEKKQKRSNDSTKPAAAAKQAPSPSSPVPTITGDSPCAVFSSGWKDRATALHARLVAATKYEN